MIWHSFQFFAIHLNEGIHFPYCKTLDGFDAISEISALIMGISACMRVAACATFMCMHVRCSMRACLGMRVCCSMRCREARRGVAGWLACPLVTRLAVRGRTMWTSSLGHRTSSRRWVKQGLGTILWAIDENMGTNLQAFLHRLSENTKTTITFCKKNFFK